MIYISLQHPFLKQSNFIIYLAERPFFTQEKSKNGKKGEQHMSPVWTQEEPLKKVKKDE